MNISEICKQFPILKEKILDKRLAYLDNAATTQKPYCVIDAYTHYYSKLNANIHRGVHYLSEKATEAYENARVKVQHFINAPSAKECIFVRSATEGINLVAHSFGKVFVQEDDEILISALEHHSNIVPWQMLCKEKKAHLRIIPMNIDGTLNLTTLDTLLNAKTKLVAITHVSNALGTLNPIDIIIQKAHAKNIPVLIDGAQSLPHIPIDVQALDCDFFVFSSHKCYGPTGIGVLYAKAAWLNKMPPFQGGGDMILKVSFEETIYNELPFKFEAGTPPIAEAYALGVALDFLQALPMQEIIQYEAALTQHALDALLALPELQLIGTPNPRIAVISFVWPGIHPHDIGTILNDNGVAIRTGHHCAMPIMDFYGIPASNRLSISFYNTEEDIAQMMQGLHNVRKIFKR